MHNCTEGAATQIDTVQQSMVNEEYRMSFKKEEMSMNKDIFFFQSLFPAEQVWLATTTLPFCIPQEQNTEKLIP